MRCCCLMYSPGKGGKTSISGTRSCTITMTIAVTQVANKKYSSATSVFHGSELTVSRHCRFLLDLAIISLEVA